MCPYDKKKKNEETHEKKTLLIYNIHTYIYESFSSEGYPHLNPHFNKVRMSSLDNY